MPTLSSLADRGDILEFACHKGSLYKFGLVDSSKRKNKYDLNREKRI